MMRGPPSRPRHDPTRLAKADRRIHIVRSRFNGEHQLILRVALTDRREAIPLQSTHHRRQVSRLTLIARRLDDDRVLRLLRSTQLPYWRSAADEASEQEKGKQEKVAAVHPPDYPPSQK